MLVPITVKRNKKICRGKDFQNRAVGSGIQTHGKELIDEAKNNKTTPKEKIVTEINKRSKRKISENSDNSDISKCKCIKQDDEKDNYSSSEESGTDEDTRFFFISNLVFRSVLELLIFSPNFSTEVA